MPRRYLFLIGLVVVIICIYVVGISLSEFLGTGTLKITTPDSSSVLSITQAFKQAVVIGHGNTSVLLHPGTYQISETLGNQQDVKQVIVQKKQTTVANLNARTAPRLASVNNVSFQNTDNLLGYGLDLAQVDNLKQALFKYKPSMLSVNINTDSIKRGPHNSDIDIGYNISFNTTIDSEVVNAELFYSYDSTENIRLQITDSKTGQLLFDFSSAG